MIMILCLFHSCFSKLFVFSALAVVIIKGIQCVLSLIHPMPSEADIRWRQNPRLPLEQHKKQIKMAHKNNSKSTINNGAKEMNKIKEPKEKRLPRNIRLERLYAGSPASFDEFIDTSFSRRSDFDSSYNRSPPPRSVDDYVVRLDHHHHHPQSQNQVFQNFMMIFTYINQVIVCLNYRHF